MRLLFSTAPPERAEALAETLVTEGLVACVNLLPGARAIYRWKGALERETETLMFMETSDAQVQPAIERLAALHPYEVPKILAFDPAEGFGPYLDWVARETAPHEAD